MKRIAIVLSGLILVLACQKEVDSTATGTTATTTTAAEETDPMQPRSIAEGLMTPESVVFDPEQDVYFISNINGDPFAADDNGYISRVNATTMQSEVRWIDGPRGEITLNAPKGLTILGEDLWVADIDRVRRFNRKTGAPSGEVVIKGATFLNDLTNDGTKVYVSDSGFKAGFAPSGTDAVWEISGNRPRRIATGTDLKKPNGLAWKSGKLWVVSFGGNELYELQNGRKTNITTLPQGGLDGLVVFENGQTLVSSWDGKAIYRGSPGQTFEVFVSDVDAPADIGFDDKRMQLLVPLFNANRVMIYPLE